MATNDITLRYTEQLRAAKLNNESIQIIEFFGLNPNIQEKQYKNFVDVMTASPKLVDVFNEAVNSKQIKNLTLLDDNSNAGGQYNPSKQTIDIPLRILNFDKNTQIGSKYYYNSIFVMGHETQHALNHKAFTHKAWGEYWGKITKESEQRDSIRNYGQHLGNYIATYRKDEASAQITGFNVIVSALQKENKDLTAEALVKTTRRMEDFIVPENRQTQTKARFREHYQFNLKNSFELNENNPFLEQLGQSKQALLNLEISARNYFDKKAQDAQLGCHGNSDYTNKYITMALAYAIDLDKSKHKTPFPMDMDGFKVPRIAKLNEQESDYVVLPLSEKIIEENGLNIRAKNSVPYIDKTSGKTGTFEHTECIPLNPSANKSSTTSSSITASKEQISPKSNAMARLEALTAKWDKAISAYESGDEAAIRASNQEMLQNPAIERMQQGAAKLHEQDYAQQQAEYERMQQQQQVQSIGGRTR